MQRLFRTLKRMLYWAWVMRNNHDWDHGYLLEMEVLKLKRMLAAFEGPESCHDPICENYKPKMKSLRLAIKLGDRLIGLEYYNPKRELDFMVVYDRAVRREKRDRVIFYKILGKYSPYWWD